MVIKKMTALWVTTGECILAAGLKQISGLDEDTCPWKDGLVTGYSRKALRVPLPPKERLGVGVHYEV